LNTWIPVVRFLVRETIPMTSVKELWAPVSRLEIRDGRVFVQFWLLASLGWKIDVGNPLLVICFAPQNIIPSSHLVVHLCVAPAHKSDVRLSIRVWLLAFFGPCSLDAAWNPVMTCSCLIDAPWPREITSLLFLSIPGWTTEQRPFSTGPARSSQIKRKNLNLLNAPFLFRITLHCFIFCYISYLVMHIRNHISQFLFFRTLCITQAFLFPIWPRSCCREGGKVMRGCKYGLSSSPVIVYPSRRFYTLLVCPWIFSLVLPVPCFLFRTRE
jgi:hypothetical protein